MSDIRIVVHITDPYPQPVRNLAALWNRDPKTLNRWAARGWIPGAFQHESGEWWFRPLHPEFLGFDPQTIVENSGRKTKAKSAKPPKDRWNEPIQHPSLRVV
jgi:hypothetical protein